LAQPCINNSQPLALKMQLGQKLLQRAAAQQKAQPKKARSQLMRR
jgi:hypothetical protein